METDLDENCTEWWQQGNYDPDHPCHQSIHSVLSEDIEVHETDTPLDFIHVLIQTLYGAIFIIGSTGNTLIVFLILRFKKLQSVTYLYILNLALADLVFLIGMPFLIITAQLGYWPFGNFGCKAYFATLTVSQISNSLMLLVLAVDRYLLLYHQGKWRGKFTAAVVIVAVWILSSYLPWPVIVYSNILEIKEQVNCNIFWPESDDMSGETYYIIRSLILTYVIYLPFILGFNILNGLKLCRPTNTSRIPGETGESMAFVPLSSTPPENSESEVCCESSASLTKMIIVVSVMSFLFWTPYLVVQIKLILTSPEDFADRMIYLFAGVLSFSVSAVSPIIYFLFSADLRKCLVYTFNCNKNEENASSSRTSARDTGEAAWCYVPSGSMEPDSERL